MIGFIQRWFGRPGKRTRITTEPMATRLPETKEETAARMRNQQEFMRLQAVEDLARHEHKETARSRQAERDAAEKALKERQ